MVPVNLLECNQRLPAESRTDASETIGHGPKSTHHCRKQKEGARTQTQHITQLSRNSTRQWILIKVQSVCNKQKKQNGMNMKCRPQFEGRRDAKQRVVPNIVKRPNSDGMDPWRVLFSSRNETAKRHKVECIQKVWRATRHGANNASWVLQRRLTKIRRQAKFWR